MPKTKLNARNVASLPAPLVGRVEFVDEVQPGLVLRVAASGARSYCYRYGRGGRRVSLGPITAVSLADARERARQLAGAVATGADPAAERRAKAAEAPPESFRDLAERLVSRAELGDRTRSAWGYVLKCHVYPALGDRPPEDITRGDVRELLAKVAETTASQANEALKITRWVFARAVETDLLQVNPCAGIRKPSRERPRDRVATSEELRKLWTAAGEAGDYGRAVKLALLTAARREEVFSARWAEVDREARVWRLPGSRTKNASPHDVPLVQDALDLLDELPGAQVGPWLFPGEGRGAKPEDKPLRPTSRAWAALLEAAGLVEAEQRITFHDLRRTVRDKLTRDLRVSPAVAEAIIGHTPPKLIRTYAPSGAGFREQRLALERWARELGAIVSGERMPGANVVQIAEARA